MIYPPNKCHTANCVQIKILVLHFSRELSGFDTQPVLLYSSHNPCLRQVGITHISYHLFLIFALLPPLYKITALLLFLL